MVANGDSDRFEEIEGDEDEDIEGDTDKDSGIVSGVAENAFTGKPWHAPEGSNPEPTGEPVVSQQTEPAAVEMVIVRNLRKYDVHLLLEDENGKQSQVRLPRGEKFGPIARSRLTPQVAHLQTNEHVRIESQ